ncbi:hypothetical protein GOP47_0024060 [Adiantum capillus-veneris]|uniref:Uncharacterized protein n=1 Tax=Adiantum capillus-veneris TaxID=13818 RepID=A0A9D4Z573_ADICA|nr:hypothetical protein GOP47_0024060 [Adiantum capillus-veneris]
MVQASSESVAKAFWKLRQRARFGRLRRNPLLPRSIVLFKRNVRHAISKLQACKASEHALLKWHTQRNLTGDQAEIAARRFLKKQVVPHFGSVQARCSVKFTNLAEMCRHLFGHLQIDISMTDVENMIYSNLYPKLFTRENLKKSIVLFSRSFQSALGKMEHLPASEARSCKACANGLLELVSSRGRKKKRRSNISASRRLVPPTWDDVKILLKLVYSQVKASTDQAPKYPSRFTGKESIIAGLDDVIAMVRAIKVHGIDDEIPVEDFVKALDWQHNAPLVMLVAAHFDLYRTMIEVDVRGSSDLQERTFNVSFGESKFGCDDTVLKKAELQIFVIKKVFKCLVEAVLPGYRFNSDAWIFSAGSNFKQTARQEYPSLCRCILLFEDSLLLIALLTVDGVARIGLTGIYF